LVQASPDDRDPATVSVRHPRAWCRGITHLGHRPEAADGDEARRLEQARARVGEEQSVIGDDDRRGLRGAPGKVVEVRVFDSPDGARDAARELTGDQRA